MRRVEKIKYSLWIFTVTCFLTVCVLSFAENNYRYPYDSFKNRDPLRPLINSQGKLLINERRGVGNFILQGIIYYKDKSVAVINNQMFHEGDIVNGYKIKKIDPYKIILQKGKEEFVLKWEG